MFYIAEIGLNHNGDLNLAREMVSAAQESGADAVKVQSIQAQELVKEDVLNESVDGFGFDDVNTMGDFWQKVSIDRDFHYKLKDYCDKLDIEFLSTPFDTDRVDLLDELGVQRYKIASGDITHYPLLKQVAEKNKPIILSTGGSTLHEIYASVNFLKQQNFSEKLALLHCVSLYPPPPSEANLKMINRLKQEFDLEVGFSDHTQGFHISLAAIAKGARVIEKHFTIDKNLPGPDQKVSAQPATFEKIVKYGDQIIQSLDNGHPNLSPREEKVQSEMRRSIVAAHNISRGKKLEETDFKYKRPATGISPKHYKQILGLKTTRKIPEDRPITWDDIND